MMELEKASLPKTVEKAVNALLKWRESKRERCNTQLLEDEELVYLILTLKRFPQKGRTNPHKIPLPHPPTVTASSELCLIIDDRPNSSLTKVSAVDKIKNDNLPISKVLRYSKLKTDFHPFEAKRKLCCSYDMFFADKRVIPLLPRLLGSHFFKKRKIPVPVDLTRINWKEQVEKVCGSALLYLGTGTCSVVKVARISMGREEIVGNVVAAIGAIAELVPKKWGNVRSFHVKLQGSLALPVYQAAPEIGDFRLKIKGVKDQEEVVGEVDVDGKIVDGVGIVEGGTSETKKRKKGRIHEVRYMDIIDGEIFGDDDGGDVAMSDDELVGKKRKKGDKVKGVTAATKVAKVKKEDGVKGKKAVFLPEVESEDGAEQKNQKKGGLSIKNGVTKVKEKKKKKVERLDAE